MEVPVFTRWWEIAIFLLGGLLLIPLIPFYLLIYLWESYKASRLAVAVKEE
tara:strand:- start:1613 stop:1765 length:153 start_codon:yes stop_codon:yes gene_type:complete